MRQSERREFLKGSIGAGMAALAFSLDTFLVGGNARAEAPPEGMPPEVPGGASPAQLEVAKRAATCIAAGDLCVAHCARELAAGNKSMGNCNKKVHDMIATCQAILSLASAGSPLSKSMAAVCADACKACADACGEHKAHFAHGMHLPCKACMESCLACEKACRDLMKA